MNAHSLTGFECQKAIEITRHYTPRIGTGGGQKANSTAVAAGEEASPPTEPCVWGPYTLKIESEYGLA